MMVKKALETESISQNFELKNEKELKPYQGNWEMAFGYINTKKKIFEMPWQMYLVMQLVQLIIEGDHSMLVSVGTGHGKSVIIQLLADMLALQGKYVVVVCLNSFLAFWASSTYGSIWLTWDAFDTSLWNIS